LPAGPYELTVEAPGFQKYTRSGITLNVGDKAMIRVRLEVGATTESGPDTGPAPRRPNTPAC